MMINSLKMCTYPRSSLFLMGNTPRFHNYVYITCMATPSTSVSLQSAELTKCTFISELSSWHKTFERSLHFNGVLKRWSSTTASSWLGGMLHWQVGSRFRYVAMQRPHGASSAPHTLSEEFRRKFSYGGWNVNSCVRNLKISIWSSINIIIYFNMTSLKQFPN